jgi:hypothetical protein
MRLPGSYPVQVGGVRLEPLSNPVQRRKTLNVSNKCLKDEGFA